MAECIILKGGNGADLDVVTAGKPDVLVGKVIVDKDGEPLTGTMPDRGAITQSLGINGIYTIPEGYHNGSGKVMQSIATMGAQTVNPVASQQVVSTSGKYLTGNVTVNGVTNLVAANIKKGVNVGGTVGTFEGYVPTATDLYLRGNNIAGVTTDSPSNMIFESNMIRLANNPNATHKLIIDNLNLTGYSNLNFEFISSSSNARFLFFITTAGASNINSPIKRQDSYWGGSGVASLDIALFDMRAKIWLSCFDNNNIYRIWLS